MKLTIDEKTQIREAIANMDRWYKDKLLFDLIVQSIYSEDMMVVDDDRSVVWTHSGEPI